MRAHTPPFTNPEAAYDSRRLYEETSAIAAAQDAKLDPGNDALPSILADFRAVVNRLGDYAERMRAERNLAGMARESQELGLYNIDWNACFPTRAQLDAESTGKPPLEPSRICTPAELAYLASFGPNNTAAPRDDAPPMFATLRDIPDSFIDSHGNRITRRDVTRHPAHAEALRDHDERLFGGEDRL